MATLTEGEIREKCEKATNYGSKKRGSVYFNNSEEQEKACLYLDFYLCYHVTGFQDDKGFGLRFRQYC